MKASMFGRELSKFQNYDLLCALSDLFNLKHEITDFIGTHPVTLSHRNVSQLFDEDFLVCEKTDGIRLMMLVYNGIIYFYDRKNKFYITDLIFKTPLVFLFDGELYLEEGKYIYALFDALIFDSKPIISFNLNKRLYYNFQFEKIVKSGYICRKNDSVLCNFSIIAKKMFKSYAFVGILSDIKNLKHENDGLIFTPVHRPYLLSARSDIFKWKPPHLNTIDFLIKDTEIPTIKELHCNISADQIYQVEKIRSSNSTVKFDYFFLDDLNQEQCNLNNQIGEFVFDMDKETINLSDLSVIKGGWKLHRIRIDKNNSNNIKVVLDTINSIHNSLSQEILAGYCEKIKNNYKLREVKENNCKA